MKCYTKLHPFQKEGVSAIRGFNERALLADEMGLGKSIQALKALIGRNRFPLLVTCPANLKITWQREIRKHFKLEASILSSRKPPRQLPRSRHGIYIINYDILEAWELFLKKMKFAGAIVDEGHYFKNPQAKRTKAGRRILRKIKSIVILTGTPTTKTPAELWPLLHILLPKRYASFRPFVWRYCAPVRRPWGWDFSGASNLKELHRKLRKRVMIRRLKKDVLKDLPPITKSVVPLEIAKRKEYEEAKKSIVRWLLKKGLKRKASSASKAEQMVRVGYLLRLAAELKMPNVIKWIDNFLQQTDEKLILFGVHKAILRPLYQKYKKIAVFIDGSTSQKDRQRAIDRFNNSKKKKLFFGNIKAAGVGWSFTSSSKVAFLEFSWLPSDISQAIARAHGLKRGKKGFTTHAYFLFAVNTIEESLCKSLMKKQNVSDETLDGRRSRELDILQSVIKTLTH